MKYILMDYVQEAGWPKLTKAEKEQWLGAYIAYVEAMSKAGVLRNQTLCMASVVSMIGGAPTLWNRDNAGGGQIRGQFFWCKCARNRGASVDEGGQRTL